MQEDAYETYTSPRGRQLPRYITKYIPVGSLGHLRAGSVKIGSLEEYRRIEGEKVLLSDRGEGTRRLSLVGNPKGFSLKRVNVEGDVFKNIGGVDLGTEEVFVYESKVDAHVYCSQIGHYSISAHRQFVEGNKSYPGNENYIGYVVYDTALLCKALGQAFVQKLGPRFQSGIEIEFVKYCDEYRNLRRKISPDEGSIYIKSFTEREMIFVKPKFFKIEKELRIRLLPYSDELGANRLILESEAVRASIVASGEL